MWYRPSFTAGVAVRNPAAVLTTTAVMTHQLLAGLLFSSLSLTACVAPGGDDPGLDGDGSGSGSGSATPKPWAPIPLLDDTSGSRNVYHQGNDLVSGIYFESPTKGFIVSQGSGETSGRGGAVFASSGRAVTSVLFSGDGTGINLVGAVDFTGIAKTTDGYIAMSYANDVILSRNGGASFSIEKNGNLGGVEPILGYRVTATGTTLVRETGVVDTASSAPSPSTQYTDTWAPNATQRIPSTIPAEQCQDGPLGAGSPVLPASVYIGADRMFIAYTANANFDPEVCISTDGGMSFYSHSLGAPASTDSFIPTGVTFTSSTNGIAWLGTRASGHYVKRTTTGGSTWTDAQLPGELAAHDIELQAAHFLANGMNGWLVGYDYSSSKALALATADGGATWTFVDGVANAVADAGGDKLYSVFALDTENVWIGGARGLVLRK